MSADQGAAARRAKYTPHIVGEPRSECIPAAPDPIANRRSLIGISSTFHGDPDASPRV